MKIITTSWDDGHVLDFRLAELLDKYNLKATFYIPKYNSEQPVMSEQQVKELSSSFEIGGHTLHHTRLNIDNKNIIETEVEGCYTWLRNITGKPPVCFAFPGGKYNSFATGKVFDTGFSVARTTELLSTLTRIENNTMPTTIQMYQHNANTYVRHLLKRMKVKNLTRWILNGSLTSLLKLTDRYISDIQKTGGCFHLWGHSWEIERYNLWNSLEQVFILIAADKEFQYLDNGNILNNH